MNNSRLQSKIYSLPEQKLHLRPSHGQFYSLCITWTFKKKCEKKSKMSLDQTGHRLCRTKLNFITATLFSVNLKDLAIQFHCLSSTRLRMILLYKTVEFPKAPSLFPYQIPSCMMKQCFQIHESLILTDLSMRKENSVTRTRLCHFHQVMFSYNPFIVLGL